MLGPRCAAFAHEPLEVGKRLGDGEPPLRRAELRPEKRQGDVVGGLAAAFQQPLRLVQASSVMLDQLTRPLGCVPDRFAVAGIDDARCELNRALE